MNINEIKQELAKKFANMSYEDFEQFEYDLKILYAHKHPNIMRKVEPQKSKGIDLTEWTEMLIHPNRYRTGK